MHPLYFNSRLLRYRLSEVLALEREASNNSKPFNGKSPFPAAKSEASGARKMPRVPKQPKRPQEPGAPKTASMPKIGFQGYGFQD